jgi:hypothetical protein
LYEIFSQGATPHGNLASSEVLSMVKAGERLARPSRDTPAETFELMRACTKLSISQRPSMTTIQARLTGVWTLDQDATMDDRHIHPQDLDVDHQVMPKKNHGEAEHTISEETAL